jgi:hypothetical protein
MRPRLGATSRPAASLLALSLIALLGSAGCGGDGSEDTAAASPPRLTKPQFVKRMNDVCFKNSQEQQRRVDAYKRSHGIPVTAVPSLPVQEKVIVQIVLPTVRRTIPELEEFRPPKSQEATMDDFLHALERATEISEKTPRWLAEPSKNYEPYMRARLLAAKIGTYLCGQA